MKQKRKNQKRKKRFIIAVLFSAVLFVCQPEETINRSVLGWWGILYPEQCFMERPSADAVPRIRFWFAETLEKWFW